jgi:hypothetical protein
MHEKLDFNDLMLINSSSSAKDTAANVAFRRSNSLILFMIACCSKRSVRASKQVDSKYHTFPMGSRTETIVVDKDCWVSLSTGISGSESLTSIAFDIAL